MSDLIKSCYTCRKSDSNKFYNLHDFDSDEVCYFDKLKSFISAELAIIENMEMCSLCVRHLRTAYKFRETVLLSQEYLLNKNKDNSDNVKDEIEIEDQKVLEIEHVYVEEINFPEKRSKNIMETFNDLAKQIQIKPKLRVRVGSPNNMMETFNYLTKQIQHESADESSKNTTETLETFNCFTTQIQNESTEESSKNTMKTLETSNSFTNQIQSESTDESSKNIMETFNAVAQQIQQSKKKLPKFYCKYCDMEFTVQFHLKKHILEVHRKTSDLQCGNSHNGDLKFTDKNQSSNHLEDLIHSNIKELKIKRLNQITCKICETKFAKQMDLKRHISLVHSDSRKFVCNHCNKVFKQEYYLKEHLILHSDEGGYSCPICDKKFQSSSSLKRHMQSHEKPPGFKAKRTPFLCTICGKNFPYSNSLQRHLRTHLGIKRFECGVCHRRFAQNDHLRVHMRTHTGEKPYICDCCGDRFSLKSCLMNHIKNKHGDT